MKSPYLENEMNCGGKKEIPPIKGPEEYTIICWVEFVTFQLRLETVDMKRGSKLIVQRLRI